MENLKSQLEEFGQGHLLQFWDTLVDSEKQLLFDDLSSIDIGKVTDYFKRTTQQQCTEKTDDRLRPVPDECYGSVSRMKADELQGYNESGLRAIAEGQVAALLLAGGQGTRLGVPYPKGMYNVGLLSNKTLYQLQAERILKLQRLATELTGKSCVMPWYVCCRSPSDLYMLSRDLLPGIKSHGYNS